MKKSAQIWIVAVIAMIMSGVAAAAEASPTDFLKDKDQKLSELLTDTGKNKDKIVNIVNSMLNFKALCRDSLGKHWESKTEKQRKDFSDTLKALIEKNLVTRLKDTKDNKITYRSETVSGDNALVKTIISKGEGPRADTIEIEYKLQKIDDGWSVIDMVTDGVSLVDNYRSQFNKIITEEGWDALINKMKDKLAE